MKTLLIMRHGKSSWKDTSLADHDRPLKKRGKKDTTRMGEMLKNEKLVPDVILCSSAKRAQQTAEILIEEIHFKGKIEYLDTLYMAEPEVYLQTLQGLEEAERVVIIGHNPGLETFLQMLVDEINSLPTAALANISLPIEQWKDLTPDTRGILQKLWLPRNAD